MAISKTPSCEIHAPVIHGYPVPLACCEAVGIKAFGHGRLDDTLGRRGKHVKRSVSCPWVGPHFQGSTNRFDVCLLLINLPQSFRLIARNAARSDGLGP